MWNKLHAEQKSKVTIHVIQQKFFNFKMEPADSIAVHSSKLQSIVQQLKELGEIVSDQMVNTKLLISLSSEYSHFHSACDSTAEELQTYDNLTARLTVEELRIAEQNQND